jgi:GTP-binding protein YchF
MIEFALVGLPNAGKSTIFNALTSSSLSKVAPYPFTTTSSISATAPLEDERLEKLASLIEGVEEITPVYIKFIDIPGLVKDAHKGYGLGNQFLATIRPSSGIILILRDFYCDSLGPPNLQEDFEILNTELLLKDLEVLERIKDKKKNIEEREKEALTKALSIIKEGKPLFSYLSCKERDYLKEFSLLTLKPYIYLVNSDSPEKSNYETLKRTISEYIGDKFHFLVVDAKLLEEISQLSLKEKEDFSAELDILTKIKKLAYESAQMISFFTVVNKKLRAWAVPFGTRVIEAAEMIHSDMKRGFISCEVINFDEFTKKDLGFTHSYGKDYSIKDGDIITIRFRG